MLTVGELKDMMEGLDDSTPVAAMVGGYYGGHTMPHKVYRAHTLEEKALLLDVALDYIYAHEVSAGSLEEAVVEEARALDE